MNKINLKKISDKVNIEHYNEKICTINDHCLRIAVNESNTYNWHYHKTTDELFIILEGKLLIEFENGSIIELFPNDCYSIKAGIVHRTIAKGRTVNLCFEAEKEDTVFIEE